MKTSQARKILYLLATLMAIALILVTGRLVVFWQIEKSLVASIETYRLEGILIRFGSMQVNPWEGSFHIQALDVREVGVDSLCASMTTVEEVVVEGMQLLPVLFQRKLILDAVVLVHPVVRYSTAMRMPRGQVGKPNQLDKLGIHSLRIDSGTFRVINKQCVPTLTGRLNFTLSDLQLWNLGSDSIAWKVEEAGTTDLSVEIPQRFYTLTVQKLAYSRREESLLLDSAKLTPLLNRVEFAKQSKYQIDQFSGQIPSIILGGFRLSEFLRPSWTARYASLSFHMNVFRDKQYPNAIRNASVLPIQFIHRLPFSMQIDSIIIAPSYVSYQEVPESGGVPGMIFFNDLHAGIYNLSTDSTGESVMKVKARFMDAGDLKATFTFPLETTKSNTISGSLQNFRMPAINRMLLPIANMEIESGQMQELKFHFKYNDQESAGELNMGYTNLKLLGRRQNKKKSVNEFTSFVINAIVKNSLDANDARSKRSGTIHWKRREQSGLLNYWWNSILSGIKAVFSLEKALNIQDKRRDR